MGSNEPKQPHSAPQGASGKPRVGVDVFERLDIRIGRVVEAHPAVGTRKPAYRLTIDFGPLGRRRSSAQITDYYRPEDLMGRLVAAVVNFPPKVIAGFVSEVLVLGAIEPDGKVVLLAPDRPCEPGLPIA